MYFPALPQDDANVASCQLVNGWREALVLRLFREAFCSLGSSTIQCQSESSVAALDGLLVAVLRVHLVSTDFLVLKLKGNNVRFLKNFCISNRSHRGPHLRGNVFFSFTKRMRAYRSGKQGEKGCHENQEFLPYSFPLSLLR